jgi:hypothetical protein
MSDFKLPPISPLAGSSLSVLRRVLQGNRVAPRYKFKVGVTKFFVLISTALQWIDSLAFKKKIKKYSFKEPPLFIIGYWRSGTTFLHNLLTRNPGSGYVTTYQAVFPNNLKSAWLFKTFMRIFMPNSRPGDNLRITVNVPQEDEYALSNSTHRSFYHYFYFPSSYRSLYSKYVRFESLRDSEVDDWKLKYRNLVIKALINTKGKQAILKNPVNTGRVLKLLEIFPDAHFVFLIRNPIMVYLSSKKFFSDLFPIVNLEEFSEAEISQTILDIYVKMLHDYLADKKQVPPGRIIEVRYEMLHENPIDEVEKIYKEFDFSNFHDLKPVLRDFMLTQKGHMVDAYSMEREEFEYVRSKLGFAMKHWGYSQPLSSELEVLD